MVVARFVLGIILFRDLNVFIYADSEFCTTKTTKIEDQHCKFKCHCSTGEYQCLFMNGTCGGYQSDCASGWIGPKCQYSNLAYRENEAEQVTDGKYWTCPRRKTFTIELEKHYPISSFTIYAFAANSKTISKATVKNSTEDKDSYINTCVGSSVMTLEKNFICTHTIVGRSLEVMFVSEETVCEIGIHGGRNIALWQKTEQSGTLERTVYTSDKAVDGDIGGYTIYSNHCSHTAVKGYPGKPFWSVSFQQPYYIQRMQIHFRELPETIIRFSNYSVTIMHQGHATGYYKKHGTPDKKEEITFTPAALGTNLTIQLPIEQSHDSNLNICEVQVFACQLRSNGETCSNTCPINCRVSDTKYRCQNYTCPENKCIGDWKGKYCNQKECNSTHLENKHLSISNGKGTKNLYLSGDKISVTCLPGYTMQGTGSIECTDDGHWQIGPTCKANMCVVPNDNSLDTSIRNKQVHFSKTVEIKCVQGYRPRNGLTSNNCDINGIWNNEWHDPFCQVNTCKLPNDVHTYTNTTGESDVIFGTSITITCDTGYHVKSQTLIRCQFNGTWSNTGLNEAPICEVITCDLPKNKLLVTNVTNGDETVSFGTTIMISCKDRYDLKGPMVSYCQLNGTWSPEWNKSALLCKEKHNLKHETHAQGNTTSNEQSDKKDGVAIGVGLGSAVFIVILLIVGITLFIKRRKNQNEKTKKNTYTETHDADAGNVYCSIEETENESETALTTDNTAKEQSGYYSFLPNKGASRNAIKVENFIDYVEENKGDDGPIASQFSSLLTGLQYPATVACFKQNKPKNKYKNIYAYDATRVVLNRPNGKSDYINASYINGYDSVKRYIACQGSMKGTEEDFWEMVYQLRSDKIVMLTNVFEEGKQKCEQYWPDKDTIQFGSMSVQLKSVDRYADFTVRLLSINKDDNGWRNVRQFHFTSWPDRGVPKYASSLVQFRHKVLSMPTEGKGPLIVHCSAGIGRTGAFIALDILVSQARLTGEMDVLACVETLRRQRVNMVQTAEQYQFLHHALEEALMCKTTATAAADFPEIYARMQQRLPNARKREIDKEFQTLNETSPVLQEEEFASGKTAENKKKNRYSNILPVESHRIYLSSYISGRSDYINAVMLPSYKESKAFIATQMPLPDTVVDFLCLVYDNDVSSTVMLNEMNDKTTLGRYWPENESELKIGPFTVTKSDDENMDNIVIQQLQIQYESKEPRIVKQFQIKFWPDADIIPSSVSDVLTLMELVQQWQRQAGGYNPVVVHCMNGCDKTGLYCVVEATIERLKIEQDVGIEQIIKQMRSRRPQIIPCIEQFEFCHEAVLEYMHQNETYSNFR